jgi:hypothetical protein
MHEGKDNKEGKKGEEYGEAQFLIFKRSSDLNTSLLSRI